MKVDKERTTGLAVYVLYHFIKISTQFQSSLLEVDED